MDIVTESGSDSILFVAEGAGESGTAPFSTEAGIKVLRNSVMVLGLRPHLLELRKSDSEDTISPEHAQLVYDYINEKKIKKVISLGKSATVALFPSIASGPMNKMVNSPLITPTEVTAKVGVMYHPLGVLKSSDPESITDWCGQLDLLLTTRSDVEVRVNKIESDDEFIQLLKYLDSRVTPYLGLDYETNAEDAFNEKHYVTMVGLSVLESDTSASSWHYCPPKKWRPDVLQAYSDFLVKNQKRVWTYNVAFEIKVSWHLTGQYVRLQDAMVLVTLFAKRGSLKNVIRSEFGAMMWEAPVNEFKFKSSEIFKMISKKPELIAASKAGDLDAMMVIPGVADRLEWMLDSYERYEVAECMTHYPYEWGAIPKDLLGAYCARDSGYTVILANKFNTPEMAGAYRIYIRHPWLAAKFEVNGAAWNDVEADELAEDLYAQKLDLLYKLIMSCNIPPEEKMEATDIFNRQLPYTAIRYTPKNREERPYQVVTISDKIEELKRYFNPGSNTAESRNKFWDIYATEDIQLGTVLQLFLEDIELSGNLELLHNAVGGKNFIYTNPPRAVMEVIAGLTGADPKILPVVRDIKRSLSHAMEALEENVGRFAAPIIKFQYQVHKTFFNLDIKDDTTWSFEWKMLFNIFLYKKLDKVHGTNVDGSTGRSSVNVVVGKLHGKPLRGQYYWDDRNLDKTLPMIMSPDFNSLSAATLRWSSGYHTIPAGSPSRRCLTVPTPKHIWVHADYSQAELVILAYLSKDPDMIQSFLDGKDMHRFIASKVFQKAYEDVTSEERRSAKAVGFGLIYGKSVENTAIEVTNGNVERAQALFDAFFMTFPGIKVWMEERKREVDEKGYVTTILGNRLEVDTTAPGNARYRVAVNAPIQCLASTIAGTSIYEFTEACETAGIPSLPVGFIHDALDDITEVDYIIEYLDMLVWKLQDEIYKNLGIPMRIDYEIGIDSFNQCSFSYVKRDGDNLTVELEGTDVSIKGLVDRFRTATTFDVTGFTELDSTTTNHSYEELFTVGKALKAEYGHVITTKKVQVEIFRHPKVMVEHAVTI